MVAGGILLPQVLQSHARGVRKSGFGCIRGNGSLHSLRASLVSSIYSQSFSCLSVLCYPAI